MWDIIGNETTAEGNLRELFEVDEETERMKKDTFPILNMKVTKTGKPTLVMFFILKLLQQVYWNCWSKIQSLV